MQGVGVNYANAFSDTNLDGDSTRKKLAEGGMWRFGGGRAPLLPPPRSLLFTLRQELILFAAFFLKKCQD